MSVVSSAAAEGFIQRLPKEIRFYLVHGLDEGLAHERVKAIIRSRIGDDTDPMRLVRLEGDAVARDPGALADEAYAISMFGGERAIWIDAQGRDLMPALEPLFARPLTDCTIVVKAGQLKKGTGLRAAFEASAARASIECYPDDSSTLESLIDAEARAAGLTIAPDARAALAHMVGADRRTTRGEIAKLMLYARGRSEITAEDVEAIVADAAPSNLDQVVDDALLGDLPAVEASLSRFFHEGGDADYLMIRLVARLTLLHRLRVEMDQGRPFEAACQALFVKLPMSARRALAKQAERWTTDSLAERLPAIRQASARVRTDTQLADVLATRALWTLAARRRGARR
ncbi:MAG: DNA polymerase III subunit delta [Hyphomicrobiales bacterium]|nr:DNA polymerase III subunit delta [Hyphomicrobiales bacterium]MBV9910716.1 DNA polymerase III subunit delta [Hyphomicrobiales bacterium]